MSPALVLGEEIEMQKRFWVCDKTDDGFEVYVDVLAQDKEEAQEIYFLMRDEESPGFCSGTIRVVEMRT